MADIEAKDRLADAFGGDGRARFIGVREKYRELLAAVARGKVARPKQGGADRSSHATQTVVAGQVPVKVIEALEVIDVDHDQAKLGFAAPRTQMLSCKRFIECTAIGEPGETILSGQRTEATIGFRQFVLDRLAHGDITQGADDSRHSAAVGVS